MDGSTPWQLASDDAAGDLATVSPDGKWLAYKRLRDTEIDIRSGHPRRLMTAGEEDSRTNRFHSPTQLCELDHPAADMAAMLVFG